MCSIIYGGMVPTSRFPLYKTPNSILVRFVLVVSGKYILINPHPHTRDIVYIFLYKLRSVSVTFSVPAWFHYFVKQNVPVPRSKSLYKTRELLK